MADKELNINIRTLADTNGVDQTAEALERVKAAGAGMGEGLADGYEAALSHANAKLDEFADALTDAGSRMRAAFEENPGLKGVIDEVSNGVLTVDELNKKFEQLDDVFEVLNNKSSTLDLGAKWGDGLDENLQRILDAYNKECDAADKAAEKTEVAEERKQQVAGRTVERLEANNRRAAASYDQLKSELDAYIAKLEEARRAGDNVAQAGALKNIQDLERRIKAAGKAGQLTSRQIRGMAGQMTMATGRILAMTGSLRGAIPFVRLFGSTFKMAMGPAGWVMMAIEGTIMGVATLVSHFKKKSDEVEKKVKERSESMQKLVADAKELEAELNNESVLKKENDLTAQIAINRKIERDALKAAGEEQKRLIDLESKILDEKAKADLLKVETDFYNGKFGDPKSKEAQRSLDVAQEGIRADARRRHRDEGVQRAEIDEAKAKDYLRNAEQEMAEVQSRLDALESSDILSANDRDIIVGKIRELDLLRGKLLGEAKKIRNNGRPGNKLASRDDLVESLDSLIYQGKKGSNAVANRILEEAIGNLGAWGKIDDLGAVPNLQKQLKRSDESLMRSGADLSTDKARKVAYEAHDKSLEDARKAAETASDAVVKAENDLVTATNKLEEARAVKAAQEATDNAQRARDEAKNHYEDQNEEKDRMWQAEMRELSAQQDRLKGKIKAQEDTIKDLEKRTKDTQHPDFTRPDQKNGVRDALKKVGKEMAPDIKQAMADGVVDEQEFQGLSRQFVEAVKSQGLAYKGNMAALVGYFRTSLNLMQQQSLDAASAQRELAAMKKQLDLVQREIKMVQSQRKNSR